MAVDNCFGDYAADGDNDIYKVINPEWPLFTLPNPQPGFLPPPPIPIPSYPKSENPSGQGLVYSGAPCCKELLAG